VKSYGISSSFVTSLWGVVKAQMQLKPREFIPIPQAGADAAIATYDGAGGLEWASRTGLLE
jgi:hypothetical protein